MADRRQFLQGGLAAFAGLLAARLPLAAGEDLEAFDLEQLERITAAVDEAAEALPALADATKRVRLSLEGCREIAWPSLHRDIIDTYDDGNGFETHVVGLPYCTLCLEYDPPYPAQDVLAVLVDGTEVDVDCRPAGMPVELRGFVTHLEHDLYSITAPTTRIEIRSSGEMIWHG